MEEIQYMLKPDWLSWQDIKDCMIKAHGPLRKKGVMMQNQTMTVEEFEKEYEKASCFVALKGKEVVGMSSYRVMTVNMWCHKGDVIYTFGDAIIPEFRGTDVYFGLQKIRLDSIKKSGIRILMFNTEENNKLVQKLNIKKGAKRVKFYASSKTWYYSVVMARWLDGCPYSDRWCDTHYKWSKLIVKLIWKPGRFIRFLPMKDSDYMKIYSHYQLCSHEMTLETLCQKYGISYKKYMKWLNHKGLIDKE